MNIKERFYANLDLIREDYDLTAKKKAKAAEGAAKGLDQLNKSMLRPFPDFVKDAKGFRKDAKRLKKKAVTGMDEEAEQLNELSDKTHMSYRAKSKNYLDKQVKMLNKRSDAEYADASKMNRRARGIKRSFKLQFRKKK